MHKRKKTESNGESNQSFILLYTCLTLLLLCFFIFLEANSVVDPAKQKEAIGSLIGAFGFFSGGISPTGDTKRQQLGFSKIPLAKDKKTIQDINEIINRSSINNIVKVESDNNSIMLSFNNGSIFGKNSVNIDKNFIPVLLRVFYKVSSAEKLRINITAFHKNLVIASERAFNIANFFHNKGVMFHNINSTGKTEYSNTALIIRFSGYVLSKGNNNEIREGDFVFKVD